MRKYLASSLILLLAAVTPGHLYADSIRANCGFSASQPTITEATDIETSDCTFSQRQGHVTIRLQGGPSFDFVPTGDAPGNYADAHGQAVYRRAGLGDKGLIFKLGDRFLYVYWNRDVLSCEAAAISSPEGCHLHLAGIDFSVQASDSGSLNTMTVSATGAELTGQSFDHEIDGSAYRAEMADLDANGWPELYVYISSAGSGSYGSLVAYAVNNGKSATPIYLRPITDDTAASAGYMGHDEFAVVENRLVQRVPVYEQGDTNSSPTGGTRQLQYKLVPGEAGWILETDRVVDY
mgnify:FL=1